MRDIFPASCFGGSPCLKERCPGAQSFSNDRVFVSIPYTKRYLEKWEPTLSAALKELNLKPILAKDMSFSSSLQNNAIMSLCSCPWGVFDLSRSGTGKRIAEGVLEEFSFGSAVLNRCLLISSSREHITTMLRDSIIEKYRSEGQLREIVRKWLLREIVSGCDNYLLSRILTAGTRTAYRSLFYCVAPHHARTRARETAGPNGGLAACRLVDLTLNGLLSWSTHLPHVCTEFVHPPQKERLDWIGRQCFDAEMIFLFDAPIAKERGGKVPLNWATDVYLSRWLPAMIHGPLARFTPLSSEEQKRHPKENKKIVFPGRIDDHHLFASPEEDVGLVVRGPHPFNPNGAVLVGAGIHAYATYAAAVAITTPEVIRSLIDEAGVTIDNRQGPFFQAALRVPRQGDTVKPEAVEWLLAQALS